MWTWGCLGSGALCPSASGAVICILGSLMELVILQYFVIAQTLSVLLSGAVPGYSRRYCRSWEWEELHSMLKLIANLPPQTSINPERNLAEMLVIDFFLWFLCNRGYCFLQGQLSGTETLSTGQRLCRGCQFSLVSISMCLLVPALLIMSMQTGSSVLNESRFLSEMPLLFKTRRPLWSLPGFPV